jgi:hypothetical protein
MDEWKERHVEEREEGIKNNGRLEAMDEEVAGRHVIRAALGLAGRVGQHSDGDGP